MENLDTKVKKIKLIPLILMIFTSVFGFANIPRAFYLMGYAAIPWYLIATLAFFIPFALITTEFGAAFKKDTGGIYSWMAHSIGPKYAFIGIFMWYTSYIVWMVSVSSSIWIPLSNAIFGSDTTSTWHLFGLNSTQTLGVLGCIWIFFITFISTKGLDKITEITSIGGIAVSLLNIVLLIGGITVLIANKGQLAEHLNFAVSPNADYQSIVSILSFITFAIFAFGGLEAVGGLVDQTENPEKNFPKGIMISAIVIALGYSLGIFMIGIFTNWSDVMGTNQVHLGNVAYVVMSNFGYQIGAALGFTPDVCKTLSLITARFVGISMFLAFMGAFFTLSYSPLKQMIEGTPEEIWPKKLTSINDKGMPANAMKFQALIVIILILIVSFGGQNAKAFFTILSLLTNVAITFPFMFITIAYPFFRKNKSIEKPFEIIKNDNIAIAISLIATFSVGFANVFTIIEPYISKGDILSSIYLLGGPVIFGGAGLIIYDIYERRYLKK